MKQYCFIFLLVISQVAAVSQTTSLAPVEVGGQVPLQAWKAIPKKETAELVILDFWFTSCATCLLELPKLDSLSKLFSNRVQFVLVNKLETAEQAQERLAKINKARVKQGKKMLLLPEGMPTLFKQNFIHSLFPYPGAPYHVWMDKEGKVLATTFHYNATVQNIHKALNGEKLPFSIVKNISFDPYRQPLLNSSFPGMYYSGFMQFYPAFGIARHFKVVDTAHQTIRQTFINWDLVSLFKSAMKETANPVRILLENGKPQELKEPKEYEKKDPWYQQNLFCYELLMPYKDKASMGAQLLEDLNDLLSREKGMESGIEQRKFQSYVLVKSGDWKEKTIDKGGTTLLSLEQSLRARLENMDKGIIFLDETGIALSSKIPIETIADLNDIAAIRERLLSVGLDIIETERTVEVMVIREKVK